MLAQRATETVAQLLKGGKRDRALIALKKKKMHDKQALQLEHNILMLDERMVALETSVQQADLIGALKSANGAIKAMQRQMPLESVEQLLEDNADASQYVVRRQWSPTCSNTAVNASNSLMGSSRFSGTVPGSVRAAWTSSSACIDTQPAGTSHMHAVLTGRQISRHIRFRTFCHLCPT